MPGTFLIPIPDTLSLLLDKSLEENSSYLKSPFLQGICLVSKTVLLQYSGTFSPHVSFQPYLALSSLTLLFPMLFLQSRTKNALGSENVPSNNFSMFLNCTS